MKHIFHFSKKAISAALALLMLAMSALLCGCDLFEQGLEDGFRIEGSRREVPDFRVAYKSETKEFDIDNVTLTFYYGHDWNSIKNAYEEASISLVFENNDEEQISVKKFAIEEFIVDKYRMDYIYDTDFPYNRGYFEFNYFEEITIPKELFTGNKGYIRFVMNVEGRDPEFDYLGDLLAGVRMFYRVVGDKVFLSENEFII